MKKVVSGNEVLIGLQKMTTAVVDVKRSVMIDYITYYMSYMCRYNRLTLERAGQLVSKVEQLLTF